WGVFGTSYILSATEVVGVGPAALGIIAGVGGASSLVGAVVAGRATRRFGLGPSLIGGMVLFTIGNAFIPLAPSGAVAVGAACLILQQFVADGGYTVYDIAEVSLRQSIVDDRLMGRVTATVNVFTGLVQLIGTIAGGLIAAAFGLRTGLALGLVGGVIATGFLWFSPVRTLRGGMPAPIDRALMPGDELPITE
ncbi:MAG TPA: MFS transporter, partial [Candidatus Limnocylindrales bacterium]